MFCDFDTLRSLKTQNSRLLALDIGDRRIGVAVSDSTWLIASPVMMLDRKKDWRKDLDAALKQYPRYVDGKMQSAIVGIVSGLPLLLNGDLGLQAQKVQSFCETRLAELNLPIFLMDERFSTHGANRALMEADMSRAKRQVTIDKVSAVFILQGVLDRLRMMDGVVDYK